MRFTCLTISAWIAASTGSLPKYKTRAGFSVSAKGNLSLYKVEYAIHLSND